METRTLNNPSLIRFATHLLERMEKRCAWHEQGRDCSLLTLWALRKRLRLENLYGTSELAPAELLSGPGNWDGREPIRERTVEGDGNDPRKPRMGALGTRFGRNFRLETVIPETTTLMTPNPREVSRELLARDSFKPATTLNLLAAAWIQFQVHDWFEHPVSERDGIEVPIDARDTWRQKPMRVPRTPYASPGVPGKDPPSFANQRTQWWDASQLYGDEPYACARLRSFKDGKLILGEEGLLPIDDKGIDITGDSRNWWLGLSMLHNLFTLEHNAICERLKKAHPHLTDELLYRHARLVNSALMAKIHTIEWTPAILGHPSLKIAMNANWTGFATQEVGRLLKLIPDQELQKGIPLSPTDHYGVDFAMTEEFVAVYRMHPLIPDKVHLRRLSNPDQLQTKPMLELAGRGSREVLNAKEFSMEDLFYSFGMTHPGAITLHNYPDFLREHEPQSFRKGRPSMPGPIDLATIDILRDRERGVPRYNDFREALRRPRLRSFDELTADKHLRKQLEEVYGHVDQVDLMVGLYAEEPPKGFGFSDTAFRIFILMASRRLKSDRFFTTGFNEHNYTRAGLDWVRDNTMCTVLARHYPALVPELAKVDNAFGPWKRTWAGR